MLPIEPDPQIRRDRGQVPEHEHSSSPAPSTAHIATMNSTIKAKNRRASVCGRSLFEMRGKYAVAYQNGHPNTGCRGVHAPSRPIEMPAGAQSEPWQSIPSPPAAHHHRQPPGRSGPPRQQPCRAGRRTWSARLARRTSHQRSPAPGRHLSSPLCSAPRPAGSSQPKDDSPARE